MSAAPPVPTAALAGFVLAVAADLSLLVTAVLGFQVAMAGPDADGDVNLGPAFGIAALLVVELVVAVVALVLSLVALGRRSASGRGLAAAGVALAAAPVLLVVGGALGAYGRA